MKLVDVLFCDDIRNELNNKVSLMGLYHDRIVLRPHGAGKIEWPIKMSLATLVRFSVKENEKKSLNFNFKFYLGDKPIVKIDGEMNLTGNRHPTFCLVLNGTGIPLEPGVLGYSLTIKDKKKEYLSVTNKKALKIIEVE